MAGAFFKLKLIRRKRLEKEQKMLVTAKDYNMLVTAKPEIKTKAGASDIKICRVCLRYGSVPIYPTEGSEYISEAIRVFGDIELREDDDYPKYLCDACNSLLEGAIIFRKSAKDSDVVLRHKVCTQNFQVETEVSDNISSECAYDNDNSVSNNSKLYDCKLCKLNFVNWDEYLIHKNSKQHRRVRIQCPICYRLLTAQLYKKHLIRHQTASHLVCDVCGKLYRKDNLVRHLQLHNYNLPFQCQICPYRGRFMESLKIHMRTHTGDKPFTCDKCELRFLTRSNLNRHLLTHKKERPHKCIECGRGFYTKRDMDVHFKSDHAGVKDFGCRLCGNKYGTRKALMRHELRVHKRDKMAKGRMPLYLRAEYRKMNGENQTVFS